MPLSYIYLSSVSNKVFDILLFNLFFFSAVYEVAKTSDSASKTEGFLK